MTPTANSSTFCDGIVDLKSFWHMQTLSKQCSEASGVASARPGNLGAANFNFRFLSGSFSCRFLSWRRFLSYFLHYPRCLSRLFSTFSSA